MAKTPVPDTQPRHSDSRQTGYATYQDKEPKGSHDQDSQPQGSLGGTGPNPNATGREMGQPSNPHAGAFEDSNGYGQTWGEGNALNGRTYRKGSRPG